MAIVINGSTGISATESSSVLGDGVVEAADLAAGAAVSNIGYTPANQASVMGRNRIINGDMRIDQRNAGASISSGYPVDRWSIGASQSSKFTAQRNAGSVTPPVGFTNYLGMTSSSAYSVISSDYFFINQIIEGLNADDLSWGTANAKTVTLSFQVYSSLTGTFGGAIKNGSANRSYPFSYTISSANTWTNISVTIPGDTSGTWATDNTAWAYVLFCLGSGSNRLGTANTWAGANYDAPTGSTSVVGTNGATFYITGVQLEVGSVATEFERRHYGAELALCQRYYQIIETVDNVGVPSLIRRDSGQNYYTGNSIMTTTMRATPTVTYTFTEVHKPGIAYDTFSGVTVLATTSEWYIQLTPTNNQTNCIACYPRTGGFQFSAEL